MAIGSNERVSVLIDGRETVSKAARSAKDSLNELGKEVGKINSLGSAFQSLGGAVGLAGVAFGAFRVASVVSDLAMLSAQVERVEQSFFTLTSQANIVSESLLSSMRNASRGTIADFDLMLTANRALALGVADSSEEITKLLEIATVRGKALGLSATTAFNDLVTGIGRISPLILDNLGIVTGGEKVFNDYAASIEKSAAALTDAERKQALINKIVLESESLLRANAEAGDDAASSYERLASSAANARKSLGDFFDPSVRFTADVTTSLLDSFVAGFEGLPEFLNEQGAALERFASDWGVIEVTPTVQGIDEIRFISSQLEYVDNQINSLKASQEQYNASSVEYAQIQKSITTLEQSRFDVVKNLATAYASASQPIQQATNDVYGLDNAQRTLALSIDGVKSGLASSNAAMLNQQVVAANLNASINLLAGSYEALNSRAKILSGLTGSIGTIASDVVGAAGANEGVKFFNDITAAAEQQIKAWQDTGYKQEEIVNVLLPAYQRQVRKAAEETYGFGQSATRASQLAKAELKLLNAEFENIKNSASGILTDAINDIGGVDLDSILPREDEVNENARRLADIAVNGFKGQNWLEEFKKEVPDIYQALVESGDPRKTAAQILRDFQDGLRPELLDKGKAKELVKRAIIGDQNLSAIADEIAREVATELGVSLEQAQSAAASALGTSDGKDAEKKITITPTIDRSGLINQDVVLTATVTDVEFGKDVSTKIEYIATVTEITIDPAVNRPILAAQMTINDIVIPPEIKPPDVIISGGMTISDVVLRSDVAIPDVEIVGTVIVTPPDTTPITSQVLLLSSQVTIVDLADSVALPILAAQMVIDDIVIGAGVQPPVPSIAGGMTITDVLLRSDADIPEVNLTATTTVTPIDVKAIESTIINVPVNLVIPEIDISATVTIVEPDTAQITDAPLVYSAIVQTATLADNVEAPTLTAPLVVSGVTLPVNTEIPKPSLTSSMAIDTVSILPSAVLPTVNLAANADVRPIDPLAISALEATPINLDATVNLPDVNLNSTVTVTPPDTSLITSTILTIPAQVSEVTLAKDAIFPQPSSTMMINEYMMAPGLLPPTPEITTGITVDTVSLADSVVLPEVTLESTVNVTPPDTSGITATTLVIPAQVNDVTLSSSAVLPQPVSSMTISEYILASGIVPPLPQITSSVIVDTVTLADNVTLPQVPLVPASVGNTAETDTETALFDLQNRLTPMVIPQIDYLSIPVEQLEAAGIWIMTGISTGITTYNIGNAIVTELYKAQTVLTEAGVSNGKTWGAGFGSGASEYITAIVATVVSLALQKIVREGTRTGAQ